MKISNIFLCIVGLLLLFVGGITAWYLTLPRFIFVFPNNFSGYFYLVTDSRGSTIENTKSTFILKFPSNGLLFVKKQPIYGNLIFRFEARYEDGKKIGKGKSIFPHKKSEPLFFLGAAAKWDDFITNRHLEYDYGFVGTIEEYKQRKGFAPEQGKLEKLLKLR